MSVKKIWFVCHYSMPPEYEMRVKTLRFAHYLGAKGIDCTIFSASTIHNTNINLIRDNTPYIERIYDDLKYVHIRCSDYTKNDIKRIINMEQFAYRFAKAAENFTPPDVVVSDTYCISYKPIYGYCKKHNVPFVLDMRDFWPQSIVEFLGYSEKNPIIQMMYRMEKNMYIHADRIIFSMEGGYDYIKDHHLENVIPRDKVFFINNGVDVDVFNKDKKEFIIDDDDLDNEKIYKVVYTGSIRKANNLGIVLDAAKKIKDPEIKILIWGDGDELEELKKRTVRESIQNVVFKGKVERKYIPYITSKADLNLIHLKASKLFKYGISSNKMFDYLAAGKPILSTFPCKYNPAVTLGAGIAVKNQTPEEIADAISFIKQGDSTEYCNKAIEAAWKYDYSTLSNELLRILEGLNKTK